MFRIEPVPIEGNEKKGPGDFSGLWRCKVMQRGSRGAWEVAFYEFEQGLPYEECFQKCDELGKQLNKKFLPE